jgi:hypothetical protein
LFDSRIVETAAQHVSRIDTARSRVAAFISGQFVIRHGRRDQPGLSEGTLGPVANFVAPERFPASHYLIYYVKPT